MPERTKKVNPNRRANVGSMANHVNTDVPYTTGCVANLCGVSARTVTKWCESGKLAYYRIPVSLDRRIKHGDLMRFVIEHKFPMPQFDRKVFGFCHAKWSLHFKIDTYCTTLFNAGTILINDSFAYYLLDDSQGYSPLVEMVNLIESKCPYAKTVVLIDESVDRNRIVDSKNVKHLPNTSTVFEIATTLELPVEKLYEQLPKAIE